MGGQERGDARAAVRALKRYRGESVAGHREAVYQWCVQLAAQGYGRLGLPPNQGGDPAALFRLCQSMALFDFSLMVKFGVHFGLCQATIARLGTERHQHLLEKTSTLELPTCFAMTETDHGSDVRGLETVARFQDGEFVVHTPHVGATKDYIGSAALHGRLAIVFGQLEVGGERKGVHALLVPIRDSDGDPTPGVTIEDCGRKAGLNGVDNGRLRFDRVRVPRDNLLDRYGGVTAEGVYQSPIDSDTRRFFTMLSNLVAGRLMVAAASTAGARAGLGLAVRYGLHRRQFGPVVLDYQAHQRRLMPRLAQACVLRTASDSLAHRYLRVVLGEGGEDRELETLAAAFKGYFSWFAVETLQVCRECCGGAGYMWDNRLGELKADLDIFTTFEGDNTVLTMLVARNLLGRFKDELSESALAAVGQWLGLRLAEMNPLSARATSRRALRSPEFHARAFRLRRDRLLASLAARMQSRLRRGVDPLEAINQCQDHVLALSRAYAEAAIFDSAEEPGSVRDLFALSRLEADRGFFLEKGYFAGAKSEAVRRQVLELCAEVREQALELVESFELPADLLDVPMLAGARV